MPHTRASCTRSHWKRTERCRRWKVIHSRYFLIMKKAPFPHARRHSIVTHSFTSQRMHVDRDTTAAYAYKFPSFLPFVSTCSEDGSAGRYERQLMYLALHILWWKILFLSLARWLQATTKLLMQPARGREPGNAKKKFTVRRWHFMPWTKAAVKLHSLHKKLSQRT